MAYGSKPGMESVVGWALLTTPAKLLSSRFRGLCLACAAGLVLQLGGLLLDFDRSTLRTSFALQRRN